MVDGHYWNELQGKRKMNRIFVDMDGVVVDFEAYRAAKGLTGDDIKRMPGAYLEMQPIPGALEALDKLVGWGFNVWLASKPPTGCTYAYADKVQWVLDHAPQFKRKVILTHDKGLLGGDGDYLIDDRPHRANCMAFKGKLIIFGEMLDGSDRIGWDWVLRVMFGEARTRMLLPRQPQSMPPPTPAV